MELKKGDTVLMRVKIADVYEGAPRPYHIETATGDYDVRMWVSADALQPEPATPRAKKPKFRVGRRVKTQRLGEGVLTFVSKRFQMYTVLLDDGCYVTWSGYHPAEFLVIPPSRWTPASQPPDTNRNVRVQLADGRKCYGYYNPMLGWVVYADDLDKTCLGDRYYAHDSTYSDQVVSWKELPKRLRKEREP